MTTLRERKRDRTREALVASANRLFAERGFDGVTVAEIAEDADVGARTFFAYFPTKEDLLFPDAGARVAAAVAALREHAPDDDPLPALMRALDSAGVTGSDLTTERARLRLRLIAEHPSVQSRALRFQADAETAIANGFDDPREFSHGLIGRGRPLPLGSLLRVPLASFSPDLEPQ